MNEVLAFRSFFYLIFGFLVTEGILDMIYDVRTKKKSVAERFRTWARSLFMVVAGVVMLVLLNSTSTVATSS